MSDLNDHAQAHGRSRQIWRMVHRAERGELSEVRAALIEMGHEVPEDEGQVRDLLVKLAGAACEALARAMLGRADR